MAEKLTVWPIARFA